MPDNLILWFIASLVTLGIGGAAGFLAGKEIITQRLKAAEKDAERLLVQTQAEQKDIILQATREAMRIRSAAAEEVRNGRQDLQKLERRLNQKEENLERRGENLDRRERTVGNRERELENLKTQLEDFKKRELRELERISGLTTAEAREILLKSAEDEARQEANRRLYQIELELKDKAEEKAKDILAQAIQRVTSDTVSELTVSVVPIPSDEMKGRIIGREGRNIRALENATGVDIIIDDTPDCVTISSFDPVRREIARIAITKLVIDGRIHPTRIEEVALRAKDEVEATIIKEGEQAVYDAGVQGLHPELIKLLGRLKYRYSYGQNVLRHSVEVTHLASIIASEIGANVEVVKKAALLHDLGKGMDHEMEGPHALVGASLVEKYEKSPQVIAAIAKHHDDWFTNTTEGVIVQVADAMSGGRPGARGESIEHYIKRLQTLEAIANSFSGVDKSYAVQAGREIRVIVKPEEMDDLEAMRLSRDIARKIEESLEYPGQIKVTVVRETRAVEYAK